MEGFRNQVKPHSRIQSGRATTIFVLTILIPAIVYFLFAFRSISGANKAIQSESQVQKIVEGSMPDIELEETASQVASLVTPLIQFAKSIKGLESENVAPTQAVGYLEDELNITFTLFESENIKTGSLSQRLFRLVEQYSDCPIEQIGCEDYIDELKQTISRLERNQAVRKIGKGVYEVYFGYGNEYLTPTIESAIDYIVEIEKSKGIEDLLMVGYTDRTGNEDKNCVLANERLNSVADYIKLSDSKLKISKIPRGEWGVPVKPDVDGKDEPLNRIVRLIFSAKNEDKKLAPCSRS